MKAKTCRNCKYASVDASDFPCSECHLTATGIRTRWLPEDSRENWEIVLVDEMRYTKNDSVSFEEKGGETMSPVNLIWEKKSEGYYARLRNWHAWIMDVRPELVQGILCNENTGAFFSMGGDSVEHVKRYMAKRIVSLMRTSEEGDATMTDSEKIELLQAKVRTLELEVRALETRHEPMPIITLPWPPCPEPFTITYTGSKTS